MLNQEKSTCHKKESTKIQFRKKADEKSGDFEVFMTRNTSNVHSSSKMNQSSIREDNFQFGRSFKVYIHSQI